MAHTDIMTVKSDLDKFQLNTLFQLPQSNFRNIHTIRPNFTVLFNTILKSNKLIELENFDNALFTKIFRLTDQNTLFIDREY